MRHDRKYLWGVFQRPAALGTTFFELQTVVATREDADKFATKQREQTSHQWSRVCDRFYVSEWGVVQKVQPITVGAMHRPDPDQPLPEAIEEAYRRLTRGGGE